jgi:hypothetical protein
VPLAIREVVEPALRRDAILFRTRLFRAFDEAYVFFAFEFETRA